MKEYRELILSIFYNPFNKREHIAQALRFT